MEATAFKYWGSWRINYYYSWPSNIGMDSLTFPSITSWPYMGAPPISHLTWKHLLYHTLLQTLFLIHKHLHAPSSSFDYNCGTLHSPEHQTCPNRYYWRGLLKLWFSIQDPLTNQNKELPRLREQLVTLQHTKQPAVDVVKIIFVELISKVLAAIA